MAPDPTALKHLRQRAMMLLAGLLVVLGLAVVAIVVLADVPRTTDLRKLGVVAAAAGLAGGAARSIIALMELAREGWRLADGTLLIANSFTRQDYERERRRYEQELSEFERGAAGAKGREPFAPVEPWLFSSDDIPELLVGPLLGAALGVVVFAGVIGGFLVTTTALASYSPAALAFLAFLGGMFAPKLLKRLSGVADVLFGDDRSRPAPSGSRSDTGR